MATREAAASVSTSAPAPALNPPELFTLRSIGSGYRVLRIVPAGCDTTDGVPRGRTVHVSVSICIAGDSRTHFPSLPSPREIRILHGRERWTRANRRTCTCERVCKVCAVAPRVAASCLRRRLSIGSATARATTSGRPAQRVASHRVTERVLCAKS